MHHLIKGILDWSHQEEPWGRVCHPLLCLCLCDNKAEWRHGTVQRRWRHGSNVNVRWLGWTAETSRARRATEQQRCRNNDTAATSVKRAFPPPRRVNALPFSVARRKEIKRSARLQAPRRLALFPDGTSRPQWAELTPTTPRKMQLESSPDATHIENADFAKKKHVKRPTWISLMWYFHVRSRRPKHSMDGDTSKCHCSIFVVGANSNCVD